MKIKDLEMELTRCYGPVEGQRVFRTVIPGILADFLRMYDAARKGNRVQEEYFLEDGRGKIVLSAVKTAAPAEIDAAFSRRM